MEDLARLAEAMSTGEVLGILYHGGSQPGAFRRIMPIRIEGDQVRARCYTSNAVKVFALAKIEIGDADTPSERDLKATWMPLSATPVYGFKTIAEIDAHLRPALEAAGWHVKTSTLEDEGEALAIFGRFKNGNLRRAPAAILSFEPIAYDVGVTPSGAEVRINERLRQRPWSVRATGKANTWGKVEKAVAAFMDAAGIGATRPSDQSTEMTTVP